MYCKYFQYCSYLQDGVWKLQYWNYLICNTDTANTVNAVNAVNAVNTVNTAISARWGLGEG